MVTSLFDMVIRSASLGSLIHLTHFPAPLVHIDTLSSCAGSWLAQPGYLTPVGFVSVGSPQAETESKEETYVSGQGFNLNSTQLFLIYVELKSSAHLVQHLGFLTKFFSGFSRYTKLAKILPCFAKLSRVSQDQIFAKVIIFVKLAKLD
jgi:hypothetical protein